MLNWLDGRNSSSFSAIGWNVDTLSFSVTVGQNASGLQVMVPMASAIGPLTSIKQNGNNIAFTTQAIKGMDYAFFSAATAANGPYQATYAPDTTLPTVSSVSPANNATSVAVATAVTATFSEAMDAATVNTSNFELRGATGTLMAAVVSYGGGHTATLTPNSPLQNGATYTATVKGGSSGVKDMFGNALSADFTWSFNTIAAPTCPCSIWNNATTPAVASKSDPNAVEVGLKFQSDINGYITGIRFYKGANTGTHTGHLWDSLGNLLASVTFSSETATGWQQANLASAVQITANTTYVVSYFAPVGRYALNELGLTTAVANPPLAGAGGWGIRGQSSLQVQPHQYLSH